MSHLSKFSLFCLSCLLALLLVIFGLRLVFSTDTLTVQLEKHYTGTAFLLKKGDLIQQRNGSIDVIGDILTDKSQITLENLDINLNYYDYLSLYFPREIAGRQLFVQALLSDNSKTKLVPISQLADKGRVKMMLDGFSVKNEKIIALTIVSPRLTKSYQLAAVDFSPKPIDYGLFGKILVDDFSTLFSDKSEQLVKNSWIVVSPRLLIFLFFCALVLIYSYFLSKAKYRRTAAWWATLIFTWLLLDSYFVLQQIKYEFVPISFPKDWQFITVMLLRLGSAWLLATAILIACLKKRYGYRLLGIGGGYVLAWLFLILEMLFKQQLSWSLNSYVLPTISCALGCGILYYFRARECSIDELRLEKSPPNLIYWGSRLLFILIVGHFLLIAAYFSHVSFGLSESSKALSAIAYKKTVSETLIIWLLSLSALGCLIFGALRYLGIYMLSAMVTVYMLLSLPIWSVFLSQSINFDILLLAMSYTLVVISLVILLSYYDFRSWFWVLLSTALLLLLGEGMALISSLANDGSNKLSEGLVASLANHNLLLVLSNVLVSNRVYLVFWALLGSLIIWLITNVRNTSRSQSVLLLFSFLALVPVILIGYFNVGDLGVVSWLKSVNFLMLATPIACLIPVAIFHLINRDKDTLPTI